MHEGKKTRPHLIRHHTAVGVTCGVDVRRLDADILKHIVEDVRDEVAVVVARRAKASGFLVASDRLDA